MLDARACLERVKVSAGRVQTRDTSAHRFRNFMLFDLVLRTHFANNARSPGKSRFIAVLGRFRLESSALRWSVGR